MHKLLSVSSVVSIMAVFGLSACTGSGVPPQTFADSPAVTGEMQKTLAQLDAMPAPAGADEQVFTMLKDRLHDMLAARSASKAASAAPDTPRSQVTDLHVRPVGDEYRFTWTYRNEGDFNQDGTVNISDLAPLGIHFGKDTTAADWLTARMADGNGDGTVDIADLTSIGVNYLKHVSLYSLEHSPSADPAVWSPVCGVFFSLSSIPTGMYRQFDYSMGGVDTGWYRVVPYDGDDPGIASATTSLMSPGRGDWYMFGHDRSHTCNTLYTGPNTPEIKWVYYTAGTFSTSIVLGNDSTLYVGYSDPDNSANCSLLALFPDGLRKWEYVTGGWMNSTPAISAYGVIYAGSGENFIAVNPDGSLNWSYATGSVVNASPAVSALEKVLVANFAGTLFCFNSIGTVEWSVDLGDSTNSSPAIASDGDIYIGCSDCNVYAFDKDGAPKWTCYTGSHLVGLDSSVMLGESNTMYVGNWNGSLYALTMAGAVSWSYDVTEPIITTPAIDSNGSIYFSNMDSRIYKMDATGNEQWHLNPGNNVMTELAIDGNDIIYCGTTDGNLRAYEPNGDLKWSLTLDSSAAVQSPTIGPGKNIYVTDDNGMLYCVGEQD